MRVVCFAGDTGAGKTTLIERLLSHLPLEPARIGILKHTHHRLEWHPPGKDTTRFWETDAGAVAVIDPLQLACFRRASVNPVAPTRELVTGCRLFPREVELVLVEGYSRALAPTVWLTVHPPRTGRRGPPPATRLIATTDRNTAAWSSEHPGTVVLTRDEVGAIASHVWEWATEVGELEALPI